MRGKRALSNRAWLSTKVQQTVQKVQTDKTVKHQLRNESLSSQIETATKVVWFKSIPKKHQSGNESGGTQEAETKATTMRQAVNNVNAKDMPGQRMTNLCKLTCPRTERESSMKQSSIHHLIRRKRGAVRLNWGTMDFEAAECHVASLRAGSNEALKRV